MSDIHAFSIENGILEDYSGSGGKVVVPDGTVRTLNQCSLGHRVFFGNETITEIVFPEGLEEIGSEACYGCTNLTYVKFPSSLKRIGDRAFIHCVSLHKPDIPSGTKNVGSAAFEDTFWMNSCRNENVYIGTQLHQYKGSIPKSGIVTIKNGTTRIADYAFYGVKGMTSVEIPKTCLHIGSSAFHSCKDLQRIVIPETVMGIGSWLFGGCTSLESAVIPDCWIESGPWIFDGCKNLKYLTIPQSFFGIYERLAPNLREIQITGTSFTRTDRNWFVNSNQTVIFSELPLQQFPKGAKLSAILGFARQYCERAEITEEYRNESLRYLRRIKKKLKDAAREHPELLELMSEEKMLD